MSVQAVNWKKSFRADLWGRCCVSSSWNIERNPTKLISDTAVVLVQARNRIALLLKILQSWFVRPAVSVQAVNWKPKAISAWSYFKLTYILSCSSLCYMLKWNNRFLELVTLSRKPYLTKTNVYLVGFWYLCIFVHPLDLCKFIIFSWVKLSAFISLPAWLGISRPQLPKSEAWAVLAGLGQLRLGFGFSHGLWEKMKCDDPTAPPNLPCKSFFFSLILLVLTTIYRWYLCFKAMWLLREGGSNKNGPKQHATCCLGH